MRKFAVAIFLLFLIFISLFLLGCEKEYKNEVIITTMQSGDTLDGIASHYFRENEDRRTWQEFRYEVMALNQDLRKNGRLPQVGDKVIVVIAKEVQENDEI